MDSDRIAALFLGAWIGCGLFMALVATQNFQAVDRLLKEPAPQAAERIQILGGHDAARLFLRYQTSELNRYYFATWERIQIALGAVLLWVLLRAGAGRASQWLCLGMLAIVLAARWWLTPEITRVGRAIDFAPAGEPLRAYFWKLHGVYSTAEGVKLLLGLGMGFHLARRGRPIGVTAARRAS